MRRTTKKEREEREEESKEDSKGAADNRTWEMMKAPKECRKAMEGMIKRSLAEFQSPKGTKRISCRDLCRKGIPIATLNVDTMLRIG